MDIQLRYSANTMLTESELDSIVSLAQEHGQLSTKKWGTRGGTIDIVTFLEIVFGTSIFKAATKPIVEGYFKGLIDEDYFKSIGKQHRKFVHTEIESLKNYLLAFYKVFISKKQDEQDAIAIIENIDDCILYVVLNSHQATIKLTERLAEAIVKTYALVTLKLIDVQEPKVIQLYPDFSKQTWEYLFMPTTNAFGKFIDRYYSFSQNQIFLIESAEEFSLLFKIHDFDEYKILVNPRNYL